MWILRDVALEHAVLSSGYVDCRMHRTAFYFMCPTDAIGLLKIYLQNEWYWLKNMTKVYKSLLKVILFRSEIYSWKYYWKCLTLKKIKGVKTACSLFYSITGNLTDFCEVLFRKTWAMITEE
jgi:hypothetical protein